LGSMKFAVWLLVVTAILSLFALIAAEFLPAGASGSRITGLLQLDDPFRSFWFRILLGLLTLSLSVCILERGPKLIRQAFGISLISELKTLQSFKSYIKLEMPDAENKVLSHFKSLGFKTRSDCEDEKIVIGASAGGISRIGPLFNHFGMLLLIIGGLLVSLTGQSLRFRGSAGELISHPELGFDLFIKDFEILYHPVSINQWVELPNGHRGKVVSLNGDSAQVSLSHDAGNSRERWIVIDSLKNDFLLRENGRLTPYQGNVQSYVTHAVVIIDGKELPEYAIEVNHPLRYGGYSFYQSSFESGNVKTGIDTVRIQIQNDEIGSQEVDLNIAVDTVALWDGLSITSERFLPDFRLDQNMQPFSASGNLNNPALHVVIFKDEEEIGRKWVFNTDFGHMGGDNLPFTMQIVKLGGIETSRAGYVTVLDVKRDNGGFIIWAGILFATLGMILVYGLQHRQAWAVIIRKPGEADTVHLAMRSRETDSRFGDRFAALKEF